MNHHQQGSAAELVRHWTSCSEQFLEAAGCLPAVSEMALPRMQLLRVAMEDRLKAYLCAARGGAPQTHDLGRLTMLAVHCGLLLTREQHEAVASLGDLHSGTLDVAGLPAAERIRELCSAISMQALDHR